MILGADGRPLAAAAPAPLKICRCEEWEGPTMDIKLIKPWLHYAVGQVVECAPNEGEWLVRTGRGEEVKADAHHKTDTDKD